MSDQPYDGHQSSPAGPPGYGQDPDALQGYPQSGYPPGTGPPGMPGGGPGGGVLADRAGIHSSVAVTGGFPDDALTSGGPLVSDAPDRDAAMALALTADARIREAFAG